MNSKKKYICLNVCPEWTCDNWKHGAGYWAVFGMCLAFPIFWILLIGVAIQKSFWIAIRKEVKRQLN